MSLRTALSLLFMKVVGFASSTGRPCSRPLPTSALCCFLSTEMPASAPSRSMILNPICEVNTARCRIAAQPVVPAFTAGGWVRPLCREMSSEAQAARVSAHVVSCVLVLWTGIAEPDHQPGIIGRHIAIGRCAASN